MTFKQIEAIKAKAWEKQRGWIVEVKRVKEDSADLCGLCRRVGKWLYYASR